MHPKKILLILAGFVLGLMIIRALHTPKPPEPKWIITQYGKTAEPIHSWLVVEPGHKVGKDYVFICQGVTNIIKWPYLITQDEINTNKAKATP
jgi:hypothetical protein